MSKMGTYCKAYPVGVLSEFPEWLSIAGRAADMQPENQAYLFVQEDYSLTKGIFLDEDVVMSEASTAWIDFCRLTLKFRPTGDIDDEPAAGAA